MQKKLQDAIKRYAIHKPVTERSFEQVGGLEYLDDLVGGSSPPIVLDFNMQKQVEDFWCWAATATSVSVFYNSASPWTQCLVAEASLGGNCCMAPEPCNKPWYLNKALEKTGNFVNIVQPMSFGDVESELNTSRVIGCRIGWEDKGGHFVVIYGIRTANGTNYYSIDDPAIGKTEVTEMGFQSAYQTSGIWTHAFTTKP